VTVLDFVRLTRAYLVFLMVATLLGAAAAYLYTSRTPDVYAADASGYIVVSGASESVGAGVAGNALGGSKAESYVPLVTGRAVAQRAIEETGIKASPAALASRVSGFVAPGTLILKVTATGPTPEQARVLADAVINATAAEAARLEAGGTDPTANPLVKIVPIDNALAGVKIAPNLQRAVLIGAAAGLIIGYLLVFLRRHLDTRIRTVAHVEEAAGSSVLGVVPTVKELKGRYPTGMNDLGHSAEAFRRIRTNLRFVSPDKPPRSIVVTSAHPNEGKSTIATVIARALADSGQPTVLIDADMRRPTLATAFDRHGYVGLSQLLSAQIDLTDTLQDTDQPNLKLITAGRIPPNPSELLGSHRMRDLIDELTQDHLVIFDAPPLLPVTDAGLLSGIADGTLLVTALNKTHKEHVRHCAHMIEQVGGHAIGIILNMAPRRGNTGYGGYGAYGGYTAYGAYGTTTYGTEHDPKYKGRRSRKKQQQDRRSASGDDLA
jgi:succinoglycan biosynthesis transport protein ExoP